MEKMRHSNLVSVLVIFEVTEGEHMNGEQKISLRSEDVCVQWSCLMGSLTTKMTRAADGPLCFRARVTRWSLKIL